MPINTSKTPKQDAYFDGKASFSEALNEFIKQGGNITRDGKITQNGKIVK